MSYESDDESFPERMADFVMDHLEEQGGTCSIELAVLFQEVKRLKSEASERSAATTEPAQESFNKLMEARNNIEALINQMETEYIASLNQVEAQRDALRVVCEAYLAWSAERGDLVELDNIKDQMQTAVANVKTENQS